jgi:hypothetical protein
MVAATEFLNRNSEREHLDTLLADVRAGLRSALVLRGEAGVGKTALLRYAARQALGFRVAESGWRGGPRWSCRRRGPELSGDSGYAYARLLMVGASIARYLVFTRRR